MAIEIDCTFYINTYIVSIIAKNKNKKNPENPTSNQLANAFVMCITFSFEDALRIFALY